MASRGVRQQAVVSIAWLYGMSTVTVVLLCLIAFVVLGMNRPTQDLGTLLASISAFAVAMMSIFANMIKTHKVEQSVKGVSYQIDGRMTDLLSSVEKLAKTEGLLRGAAAEASTSPTLPQLVAAVDSTPPPPELTAAEPKKNP